MKTQLASDGFSSLRVLRFRSIHEINEQLWDTINSGQDLFHTHRFIRSVEDGRVEDSRFRYLLFYQDDTPVGAAALCSFTVSLDLLTEGWLQKAVKLIRRWIPNFMNFDILSCGLPVSIGKHTIAISDVSFRQKVLDLLVREMTEIGSEEKIRILCLKEFLEGDAALMDPVTKYQFFRFHSLPYMKMGIHWKDFESYIAQMRHGYRRHILRSVRKLGGSKPVIYRGIPSTDTVGPVLALINSDVCPPGMFYELYLNVMERAINKLEILDKHFFENIYKNLNNELELLSVIKKGRVLAAAMLTIYKGTMTFMLVGLNYKELKEYDVYLNLIYGIVALAIERGCLCIELGQTAYWAKQQLGAESIASFFYIREEHWHVNRVFKILAPFLFPEMKLQTLRVFR